MATSSTEQLSTGELLVLRDTVEAIEQALPVVGEHLDRLKGMLSDPAGRATRYEATMDARAIMAPLISAKDSAEHLCDELVNGVREM